MIWNDVIWYDMIWYDMIWYDMEWCDMVWYGMMWCDMEWYDMIWNDVIWYDMIWYDMIWYDMEWCDMVWYGMMWCDMEWYDMIWNDVIWYTDVIWLITKLVCDVTLVHLFSLKISFQVVYWFKIKLSLKTFLVYFSAFLAFFACIVDLLKYNFVQHGTIIFIILIMLYCFN